MNPFSPTYYVKENKVRCILLILVFMLTYGAWIGGLYVTNIGEMYRYSTEQISYAVRLNPTESDENFEQLDAAFQSAQKKEGVISMQMGVISSPHVRTIMGFDNDFPYYSFCSVDDFRTFCRITGVFCQFDRLKPGSVVMSRLMANNRGMQLGDTLEEREGERIYGTYTLDAITEEPGYTVYYVDTPDHADTRNYLLLADGLSADEFADYTRELMEKYDISVMNRENFEKNVTQSLKAFHQIYLLIVLLLAVVMAVTISAAFVEMYQHRAPEFAIYRAIGIPGKKIIRKIAGELFLLDGIAMAAGGAILMVTLYLLNELYLIPRGLQLFYYHPLALLGTLLCNIMVIIPLIVTRTKQLLKENICNY